MPKISFIGAGNVAWHLAPALDNAGYTVQEVYSPKGNSAKMLVQRLYQAYTKDDLDFGDSSSRIFIISVPDDAIEEVVREVVLPDSALLVHTSGSKPLQVLEYAPTENIGVFYPLQTFTKSRPMAMERVPILIETLQKEVRKTLWTMGKAISNNVRVMGSEQRRALHVAAVFACNFTNHLMVLSKDILSEKQIDFSIMQALIEETIGKSLDIGPENAQTGPAKRGDLQTLDEHLEYLKERNPDYGDVYKVLTQHILDTYQREE